MVVVVVVVVVVGNTDNKVSFFINRDLWNIQQCSEQNSELY